MCSLLNRNNLLEWLLHCLGLALWLDLQWTALKRYCTWYPTVTTMTIINTITLQNHSPNQQKHLEGKSITSVLRVSSLKKSNRTLWETGSHTEETAHSISPRGSLGSFKFFLELILMSSPFLLVTLVHVWKLDAPTAWQKPHVILCANFKMLFLPANVATPNILSSPLIWLVFTYLFIQVLNEQREINGCKLQQWDMVELNWLLILTSGILHGDISCHEENKTFALKLQCRNPVPCPEGQATVHNGAIHCVDCSLLAFQVLHPDYLNPKLTNINSITKY